MTNTQENQLSPSPQQEQGKARASEAASVSGSAENEQSRTMLLQLLLLPFTLLKRLYKWVVGWADRPGGSIALAGIAFAEASFFPIPPDPLLMALCIGKRRSSFKFSLICTLASVAGGVFGWMLGKYLFAEVVVWTADLVGASSSWFGTPTAKASMELAASGGNPIEIGSTLIYPDGVFWKAKQLFDDYGFVALFVAALTPIPYKVATIASGVFGLGLPAVVLGSLAGRGLRFFAVGTLFFFLGDWAKRFIDKHFTWLSILGAAMLIGGFYAVKYLL